MGTSVFDTEKPWHMAHTQEEWTQILHHVLQAHRQDPNDTEALQAIKQANEALNAYDQPAITAGEHTLQSGWGNPVEGIKGELEGMGGAALAPLQLANTAYRKGIPSAVDQLVEGIKGIPGEITSGDPRRIGNVAGNVAGSIAIGSGAAKLAKGTSGMLSAFAERPMLKNLELKAQAARATSSSQALQDLMEQRKTDAPIKSLILDKRSQIMDNQIGDASAKSDLLAKRGTNIDANTNRVNLSSQALQDMIDRSAKAAPFHQSILEANDYATREKAYAPKWPEPPAPEPEAPPMPETRPLQPPHPQNAQARALQKALDALKQNP